MKRFKFSLQSVHDFREFRRDEAEREFAETIAQLERIKVELETIQGTHRESLNNYVLLFQCNEVKPAIVSAHTDYIASIVRREREVRIRITVMERQIELKRQAVTEALRATKTTANLRDNQRQRHEFDIARTEQNLMDEMAVMAMARRVHR